MKINNLDRCITEFNLAGFGCIIYSRFTHGVIYRLSNPHTDDGYHICILEKMKWNGFKYNITSDDIKGLIEGIL